MWDISDILLARTTPFTFNVLHSLLEACGLEDELEDYADTFTLFAPPDEAFSMLDKKSPFDLFKDIDKLRRLLDFHIVPLKVEYADLQIFFHQANEEAPVMEQATANKEQRRFLSLDTLSGQPLHVTLADDFLVENSRVLYADILTANGAVHVIERILWPAGLSPESFHGNVPFSKAELT
ncbi:hypothetical protein KDA_59550 [Dictyobacter alpinus]|uniref:FAS1 domain-containing protein n=1 Tax=Dictyobacter alpinus TaxID=2014873 RepID=A0A402BGD9_9CHLR|nr:fasciclin domain-containing protein [Dictyobacter alpinus]GCE30471.1 hypothetical protein KDA_59550 [Dictyobacter alpinus]